MRTFRHTPWRVLLICLVGLVDRGMSDDLETTGTHGHSPPPHMAMLTSPRGGTSQPERLPPAHVQPRDLAPLVPPQESGELAGQTTRHVSHPDSRAGVSPASLNTPFAPSQYRRTMAPTSPPPMRSTRDQLEQTATWTGSQPLPRPAFPREVSAPIRRMPHPYGESPTLGLSRPTGGSRARPWFRDVPAADRTLPASDFHAPVRPADVAPISRQATTGQLPPAAMEPLVARPLAEKDGHASVVSFEVAQFAAQQVEEGYQLAMRGATHSARARFTRALEIVADALDMAQGGNEHRDALWNAVTAMQEAKDFLALRSQRQRTRVGRAVEVHKTPILKERADLGELAAMEALQLYFTYASRQLRIAGGATPVASNALYQLGKLTPLLEKTSLTTPTSYAYYQAALEVDQQNHLAANELGVLLANMGYLDASQATLRHSLTVSPSPAVWHNLAVVHKRKGEHDLAAQARQQGQQLTVANGVLSPNQVNPIVWLPNEEFARVGHPGRNRPMDSRRR